jgi:hypothetical protein
LPKLQPHPLKYRELLLKLNNFGIIEHPNSKRGKGSERILILVVNWDSKNKKYHGPQYPIKCHGDGTEIYKPVISKILSYFGISSDTFWDLYGSA